MPGGVKPPKERWRQEHKVLRRRLEQMRWSAAELRFLQKQAKGLPHDLERLIAEKLRKAEEELCL